MSSKKLAVVILNWNTRPLLEEFLPQVVKYSNQPNTVVAVADNGSTDDSVEWIKKNFPQILLLELGQNYGFAEGYNQALKQLDTELVVLLNSDAAPSKGWLNPLIDCLNNNPNVAACVPKIKDYNHPHLFEYAGAAGGYIDRLGYPFCRGRIFEEVEVDNNQYNHESPIFWGSGAALTVRRELFLQSGGLDSDFFAHMEEIDWCWRIKNQGYAIHYVPESTIYHAGGGTLSYLNSKKNYLNFRNNLFLLLKNRRGFRVYPLIVFRMIMDFLALLNFAVKREPKNVYAIHLAHRHFLRDFKKFYRKRKELKQKLATKQYLHKEIYRGSIVWDYYIKKVRKFSQIKQYQ